MAQKAFVTGITEIQGVGGTDDLILVCRVCLLEGGNTAAYCQDVPITVLFSDTPNQMQQKIRDAVLVHAVAHNYTTLIAANVFQIDFHKG